MPAPTIPGQLPNERAILVLHRHWFAFVNTAATFLILTAVPIAIGWLGQRTFTWQLDPGTFGYILVVAGGVFYYLFLWILFYGFWLDYSLDYFEVTNQRVIDVEQIGLFDRTVAEQKLDRVQDVTSEMKGFFPTMLRYGNVYVQTAAEKERFVFEQVSRPDAVAKAILQAAAAFEGSRGQRPTV